MEYTAPPGKSLMNRQITVRLDPKLARRLRFTAKRLGLRPSDVVRAALHQFLDALRKKHAGTPYQRVKHLIGKVSTGIPDLAEEHRRYILESLRRRR